MVAPANGGSDMVNSLRQAHEFGIIEGGQKIAALLPHLTDIHSLGLPIAKGHRPDGGFLLGPHRCDAGLVEALL